MEAGSRQSAWFLAAGLLLAQLPNVWNQTVNLLLIKGASEWRHVPLPLIDLRIDLRVSQFLGFGGAQVFGSDGLADGAVPATIRAMAGELERLPPPVFSAAPGAGPVG